VRRQRPGVGRRSQRNPSAARKHAVRSVGEDRARTCRTDFRRTATRGEHRPATLDRWAASNQASHSRGGTALKANYPASYPSIWAASVGAVTLEREVDCVEPNSLSPESGGRGGGSKTGVGDPRDLNNL